MFTYGKNIMLFVAYVCYEINACLKTRVVKMKLNVQSILKIALKKEK